MANNFPTSAAFTYNFKNTATQTQNGIDFHFDWGASHFLSKQLFVGMVGYAYQQVTDDIGAAPFLNGFKSRVFGIGPNSAICSPSAHPDEISRLIDCPSHERCLSGMGGARRIGGSLGDENSSLRVSC